MIIISFPWNFYVCFRCFFLIASLLPKDFIICSSRRISSRLESANLENPAKTWCSLKGMVLGNILRKYGEFPFPRHPVLPPEVWCWTGMFFGGPSTFFSGGVWMPRAYEKCLRSLKLWPWEILFWVHWPVKNSTFKLQTLPPCFFGFIYRRSHFPSTLPIFWKKNSVWGRENKFDQIFPETYPSLQVMILQASSTNIWRFSGGKGWLLTIIGPWDFSPKFLAPWSPQLLQFDDLHCHLWIGRGAWCHSGLEKQPTVFHPTGKWRSLRSWSIPKMVQKS